MATKANRPPPALPQTARPALQLQAPSGWQPSPRLTAALAALLLGIAERRAARPAEAEKGGRT